MQLIILAKYTNVSSRKVPGTGGNTHAMDILGNFTRLPSDFKRGY